MKKQEFLRILEDSLSLSLEKEAINSQLDYYDEYISDEVKSGKREEEVIDELGDPRLIAKTIKTVNNGQNAVDSESKSSSDNYNSEDFKGSTSNRGYSMYVNNTSAIGCVIVGLVLFIIVYGILSFMGRLAYGVGTFALSGPIGFLVVATLLYMFFGGRRR